MDEAQSDVDTVIEIVMAVDASWTRWQLRAYVT